MKRAIYILMCMMLTSISAFAQEEVKLTDIKGVHVDEDGKASVNIQEFLSVPEQKALFVKELNRRLQENQNAKGVADSKLAIKDFDITEPDNVQTDSVLTKEGKTGKRKAGLLGSMGFGVNSFIYTYESVDGNKNPITLSARAYVPGSFELNSQTNMDLPGWMSYALPVGPIYNIVQMVVDLFQAVFYADIQTILLSCHPTVTSNSEAPTGNAAPEAAIQSMNTEHVLVVCPDYCGYGITAYMQHPYLIEDITARQCIDAELEALNLIGGLFNSSIAEDYYTNIIGYSQGGAVALACTKYLESEACPYYVKDAIKLNHTYCGDGPYSTVETVKQYLAWEKEGKVLEYPCVLPLIVMAAKDAYNDGCMRSVNVDDYFSEDFKKTGIVDMLKKKTLTTSDLNNAISTLMGRDDNGRPRLMPSDLFSEKMLDENSNEYKCLMKALKKNDLTYGWTPTHKLTFYHWTADGVVPYCNTEAIKRGIGAGNPSNIEYVTDRISGYAANYPRWNLGLVSKGVSSGEGTEINHAQAGILFYVYYMSGALRPHTEQ